MNLSVIHSMGISFESCCLAENKRYFFLNEWNALCSMETDTGIINYVGMVPWEDGFHKYLFSDIQYYKGNLILVPRGASAIAIYSIRDGSFHKIEIEDLKIKSKNQYIDWLKFSGSVIVEGCIYMIPRTFPGIAELDLETYEITYYKEWIHSIDDLIFENEAFFWADYIVRDRKIILASGNADCLMFFDTETKTQQIVRCDNNRNGFSGIADFNSNILLASRKDGAILLWNSENHTMRNFGQMPPDFHVDRLIGFSKLIGVGGEIAAIPYWANMLLKLSPDQEKIMCLKNYEDERKDYGIVAVCCAWAEDEKLYCHNNLLKRIDVFDTEGAAGAVDLVISEDFCRCMERDMRSINRPLVENEIFSLEDYLEYVSHTDETITCEGDFCGKNVYKLVKG